MQRLHPLVYSFIHLTNMCEIPVMCIIGLGSEIITVNQDKSMPSIAQREVGVNMRWDDHLGARLGRAC